jgi:pimeloyl-ACP methyl ester carboxylesterase
MLMTLSLLAQLSLAVPQVHLGTIDSNGVDIRYAMAGEGEAVVLIHGWMSDATMWGRDATGSPSPKPPKGFKVIALDCRGHGKSGKPHETSAYGELMASDVVRLLDHLKIDRAHLVGYSMGSFIAGKVVADHPKRVISAIYGGQVPLVAGAPSSGSKETEIFARAVEQNDLPSYFLQVAPSGRPKPTPKQAELYAKLMFEGKDTKALAAAGLTFDRLEVQGEALVKSKVPSLFIYGSKESDHLKGRVADLRKKLFRAEEVAVDGADHVTLLARPEFGTAIVKFLEVHRTKP